MAHPAYHMNSRTLGSHGFTVSAIGLGCMGMSHGYGPPPDRQAMIALLRSAVDLGVTYFDTAEAYGPFANEDLIAEALAPFRDHVTIGTKFGVRTDQERPGPPQPDSRPHVIRRSVEGSLRRLNTDCIDLYYQHRVDPAVPVEDIAGTVKDLIAEGKVARFGLCEADADTILRAHAIQPITAVQSQFSMMWQAASRDVFPTLERLGVGLVAFSPLGNGFLSAAYDPKATFDPTDLRSMFPRWTPEARAANQSLLDVIGAVASRKHATPAQIAIAWVLGKKPWIVPIPGTRRLDRLKENLAGASVELSPEEVGDLDRAIATSGFVESRL
jgi:aryl-alcohol dehydrogenase-like predicted oxidoreductase